MTTILFGPLSNHTGDFAGHGKKALIVTGRSSAKNCALNDVLSILHAKGIGAEVFDRTEENPSVENVLEAAQAGRDCDFVIGIGGGSPLDAAKAAALLMASPEANGSSLYDASAFPNGAKPVLAIPTTAGTGSEVTPFAILTRHSHQTKASIPHLVYPRVAFLNPAYTVTMSDRLTLHTAVDALSHLMEGYLSSRANPVSDRMAEGGFCAFGLLTKNLTDRNFDAKTREMLLSVSTLAGMVITQAKTSLPHMLGYALTYHKDVPHGAACGLLLAEYLRFHADKEKTGRILTLLGLFDIDSFKSWLGDLLNIQFTVSDEEISSYVRSAYANPEKLKVHPGMVTESDLTALYQRSL